MALETRRERFFLYHSLVCLAKGLVGKYTIVDLRNESCVTGKIDHVDGYMNVTFEDAVFIDSRGTEFAYDSFFVQARKIRYIHIPSEMGIIPTIEKQLSRIGRDSQKTMRSDLEKTRKSKQRRRRQEETLKLVQEYKEEQLASKSAKGEEHLVIKSEKMEDQS